METIRSFDNSKIKHVKKLLDDKKYRAEQRGYVAEGVLWVKDALSYSMFAPDNAKYNLVRAVFIKESSVDDFVGLIKFAEQKLGADKVFTVADKVFDKVSDTEHSQEIMAELGHRPRCLTIESPYILYLDRIRDPGNLGTIIRSAVAAGFDCIFLDNCADIYSPKVVRSTMGALLKIEFHDASGSVHYLKMYHGSKDGYTVFAADMGGENVFKLREKPEKVCLIIGSEADGIRPELLAQADKIVSIPMQNTESLNAAVAAGILMYQLRG
ncbi:MAG: RNA methyltransferase [Firmicutes bacterium]|nr:RNA methyltransferase [Bacillota bacterium]